MVVTKLRTFCLTVLLTFSLTLLLPRVAEAETARTPSSNDNQYIFDNAGLFTDDERLALEERFAAISADINMQITALTLNGEADGDYVDYGKSFFTEHQLGFGKNQDGAMLIIDMAERKYDIITHGKMIVYMTDKRIDSLLDDLLDAMSAGDYLSALDTFGSGILANYQKGVPKGQYEYDEDTGKIIRYKSLTALEIGLAGILAIAAGAAAFFTVSRRYNMQGKVYTYHFQENSSLTLSESTDIKTNEFVTTRRIPKKTSSGGGGSGGGRSTTSGGFGGGGGGRSF